VEVTEVIWAGVAAAAAAAASAYRVHRLVHPRYFIASELVRWFTLAVAVAPACAVQAILGRPLLEAHYTSVWPASRPMSEHKRQQDRPTRSSWGGRRSTGRICVDMTIILSFIRGLMNTLGHDVHLPCLHAPLQLHAFGYLWQQHQQHDNQATFTYTRCIQLHQSPQHHLGFSTIAIKCLTIRRVFNWSDINSLLNYDNAKCNL